MSKSVAMLFLFVLCVCGFLVDGAMALLTAIGIPYIIVRFVPVLVFGYLLEACSLGADERNKILKWIRIIFFGMLFASAIVYIDGFLIETLCMLVIFVIALLT